MEGTDVIVQRDETVLLNSSAEVVTLRQKVRSWTADMGFNLVEQTKIVTAASELARNTVVHGGGGTVRLEEIENGARRGIRLRFEDRGPGIPDIETALRDGFTTSEGLGLGLGGARRLSSEFRIDSEAGNGTRVTYTRWKA
jgi:serine/threonine-protein kinase RsbT